MVRQRQHRPSIVTVMLLGETGTTVASCRWCGRAFDPKPGPGRPRLYCRHSCRQRDYEARRRAAELGLGEHELVVTRQELDELKDRIFVLAKTLEDVEQDLTDDDADDERRLLNVLLYAVRQAVA